MFLKNKTIATVHKALNSVVFSIISVHSALI